MNRDGRGDIFFHQGTALAYSTAGTADSGVYAGDGGAGYTVVAVSDFDGDRSADVLWSNGSHLKLWINDGSGDYTAVSIGSYGGGWEPFAAGDINGDGKSDLFFRGTTHLAFWLMDGASVLRSSYAGDGGAGYRVVAIDDFTSSPHFAGDRSVDVLWTNGSQLKIWVSDTKTSTFTPYPAGSYGGGWEPFAAGDIDGDAFADILFRGGSHIAYWRTDRGAPFAFESYYAGDAGAGFRAIAANDMNSDGATDVLWSNGYQLKLWEPYCWGHGTRCGWDVPRMLGNYGNGWQPLEMLIAQD